MPSFYIIKTNEKTLGHLILDRFAIFNPTYCPRPLLLPLPLPTSLQQPPSSSKSSSFSSSTFSMTTGTVFLGDLDLVVLVLAPKGFSEVLFLSLLLSSWFSDVEACEEEVFPFLLWVSSVILVCNFGKKVLLGSPKSKFRKKVQCPRICSPLALKKTGLISSDWIHSFEARTSEISIRSFEFL